MHDDVTGFRLLFLLCALGGAVLASASRSLASDGQAFSLAEPVWHDGHERVMNEQLLFTGTFDSPSGNPVTLRVASSNPYRVLLNGKFAWYGPARGPRGYARMDTVSLSPIAGRNEIAIENAGYNVNSYYFIDQPSFLQAEVLLGKDVILRTAALGGKGVFSARTTGRVRKVNRYSYQRMFAEVYDCPCTNSQVVTLASQPMIPILKRHAADIDFSVRNDLEAIGGGTFRWNVESARHEPSKNWLVGCPDVNYKGYLIDELECDTWDCATRFCAESNVVCSGLRDFRLCANQYVRFEAPCNRSGFPIVSVKCREPGELQLMFDERLCGGGIDVRRSNTANLIVWRITAPGVYELETFEPYVLKYMQLLARTGVFEVQTPRFRLYRANASRGVALRSSDPVLDSIFAAAEETYAQNAVDLFTDCPGRERAGWNCDAYFTARTAYLLTGSSELEYQYLENYLIPTSFPNIPFGMLPMCYPSDQHNGDFIPSWALFMVLQLEEYANSRRGDRLLIEGFRSKLMALVDYLSAFKNQDGLLESLPSWVFVEWSHANKLVQDVNYPNNMLWAAALSALGRLYCRPDFEKEAERVRETIRRQSWNGEWFCDNAVRRLNGSLVLSGECTETCQYYAFCFGVAEKARYPRLYERLKNDFGPKRRSTNLYPEIWASNAFIGNYLRLEWLAREGCSKKVYEEVRGYFQGMAKATGTLWEHEDDKASCCHGFASHVAVSIIRDIVGVRGIDFQGRTLVVSPPQDVPLDYCEVTVPVSEGKITVGWRREGCKIIPTIMLPSSSWHVKLFSGR